MVDITIAEAPLWAAMADYSVADPHPVDRPLGPGRRNDGRRSPADDRPSAGRITEAVAAFRARPEDGTAGPRDPTTGGRDRRGRAGVRDHAPAPARGLGGEDAPRGPGRQHEPDRPRPAQHPGDRGPDLRPARGERRPGVRRVAPRLVETLDRAVRLCGDTLTYARSGPPAPEPRRIAAGRAGGQGARGRGRSRGRRDAGGSRSPADLGVEADPDQLFRVLLNLVRNAVEAMGGAEAASCGSPPSSRQLAHDRRRRHRARHSRALRGSLFEPFAGSAKSDGNGIGLAICRELINAHGGEIELVGTSDRGTTFRLRLPRRAAARATGARRSRMPLENVVRDRVPLILLPRAATTRVRRWPAIPACRTRSNGTTTAMRWSRTRPAPSRGCARSPARRWSTRPKDTSS